jgi:LPS-assembly lipoprotein
MKRAQIGVLTALASGVALLGLGGCGFTPLYAAPGVSPGLSAIEVHAPQGRTAYLLGRDLDDGLNRDVSEPAVYRLDFSVAERRYPRGLRINNVATLYETHVTVGYQLIEVATGRLVKAGTEPIQVEYDVADQPYAGVAAQLNGQERAAEEAARRIRADLAVYFMSLAQKK